ncbi:hypothetical protein RHSIM_Rhsim02G0182000 [Rhododendron simsii]|uniref:Thioredoxin domain-containing protein n=1 Tax=Rhododendron simsii TaxID=118357 RepID=A0A834LSN5_RHOSS|nr:hypothetical protein RHSIM_Rhsim02G0182000 [Rhododendron simsii]
MIAKTSAPANTITKNAPAKASSFPNPSAAGTAHSGRITVVGGLHLRCLENCYPYGVVTSESWNKVVLQSATPVLVEFHGSGCGPCNKVREVVDKLAREYDGQLKFFVLYTDHDGEIAESYKVEAVPVSMVFKNWVGGVT